MTKVPKDRPARTDKSAADVFNEAAEIAKGDAPKQAVPLTHVQEAVKDATELAGHIVHDASTGEVWDFDTVPAVVAEWTDAQLKDRIIRLTAPVNLATRHCDNDPVKARALYQAILDAALGMRWEEWAGQPAMRVLVRPQLEKVYTVAQYLNTDRKDALIAYLQHRHAAMRGHQH